MKEWIIANVEWIRTAVLGAVVWFFTKRQFQKVALDKEKANVTGENLGNVTDTFIFYILTGHM